MVNVVLTVSLDALESLHVKAAQAKSSIGQIVSSHIHNLYGTSNSKNNMQPLSAFVLLFESLQRRQPNQECVDLIYKRNMVLDPQGFSKVREELGSSLATVIWLPRNTFDLKREYLRHFEQNAPIEEIIKPGNIQKHLLAVHKKIQQLYCKPKKRHFIVLENLNYYVFYNYTNLEPFDCIEIRYKQEGPGDIAGDLPNKSALLDFCQYNDVFYENNELRWEDDGFICTSPYGTSYFGEMLLRYEAKKNNWAICYQPQQCKHLLKNNVSSVDHILNSLGMFYVSDNNYLAKVEQHTSLLLGKVDFERTIAFLVRSIHKKEGQLSIYCSENNTSFSARELSSSSEVHTHIAGVYGAPWLAVYKQGERLQIKVTPTSRKEFHVIIAVPRCQPSIYDTLSSFLFEDSYELLEFDANGLLINIISSKRGFSILSVEFILEYRNLFQLKDVVLAHLEMCSCAQEGVHIWNNHLQQDLTYYSIEEACNHVQSVPHTYIGFTDPQTKKKMAIDPNGDIRSVRSNVVPISSYKSTFLHSSIVAGLPQHKYKELNESITPALPVLMQMHARAKSNLSRRKISILISEYYRENPYSTKVSWPNLTWSRRELNGLIFNFSADHTYLQISVEGSQADKSSTQCIIPRYDEYWLKCDNAYDTLVYDWSGNLIKVRSDDGGISILNPEFIIKNFILFDRKDVWRALMLLHGFDPSQKALLYYYHNDKPIYAGRANFQTAIAIKEISDYLIVWKNLDGQELILPSIGLFDDSGHIPEVSYFKKEKENAIQIKPKTILHLNSKGIIPEIVLNYAGFKPKKTSVFKTNTYSALSVLYNQGNKLDDFLSFIKSKTTLHYHSSTVPFPEGDASNTSPFYVLRAYQSHIGGFKPYPLSFVGDLYIYNAQGELINIMSSWIPGCGVSTSYDYVLTHGHLFTPEIRILATILKTGLYLDSFVRIKSATSKLIDGNVLPLGIAVVQSLAENASIHFSLKGREFIINSNGIVHIKDIHKQNASLV